MVKMLFSVVQPLVDGERRFWGYIGANASLGGVHAAALKWNAVATDWQPVLSGILTVVQIVIGVLTVVHIVRKWVKAKHEKSNPVDIGQ